MKHTPLSIKKKYYGIEPPKPIYIKNKGFFRKTFFKEWTIGYSIQGGAILQFTKDVPKTKMFLLNLWFFSFRRAWKPGKSDEFRIWINFGWNQGLPRWMEMVFPRTKYWFDNMMMGFSAAVAKLIDKMLNEAKESENA